MDKEKFKQMGSVGFTIANCPITLYERFVEFCKRETGDSYWFGIKVLLDAYEQNIKEVVLYEKFMLLDERLSRLENKDIKEEPVKTGPKTMGSSKMVKKEEDITGDKK